MSRDNIDNFENYLEGPKIKKEKPDLSKAKGLIKMALNDSKRVLDEEITEEGSSYAFKNAYDVIRSAITAHMALEGYNSYSHTAVIAYARDVLSVPENEISKLNKFRKIRNNIEYRAEKVTEKETKDIVKFMESFLEKMNSKFQKRV